MAQEIERKFRVVAPFKELAYTYSRITQGYISQSPEHTVRVRVRDDKGYLTIKGPSYDGGLSRYEFETEIAVEDAKQLLKLCKEGLIDKTRYLVKNGQHTIEVDEFYGENEGLILAEIELQSADEPFIKPDFLGEEVTGDKRFYNSHLLHYPYSQWK